MRDRDRRADVVVVGGGLAGLAAAAYLAKAGRVVALMERSPSVGGRAITHVEKGFHLNLGPHALYQGRGAAVLRELGVQFHGGMPATSRGYALHRGAKQSLPTGVLPLLTTELLTTAGKLEVARLFATLPRLKEEALQAVSVREWLGDVAARPEVRALLLAFIRLASYANDPDRMSAGAAFAQVQLGQKGVIYLDGGWQTLVDGLRRVAEDAGVDILTRARVEAVERDHSVTGVRLADGARWAAQSVIVATGPRVARDIVEGSGETSLAAWADEAIPVKAACLDIALTRLPRHGGLFALGIDEPLYFSVHSAVAALAPSGGALIHLAKYLGSSDNADPQAVEQELERVADALQPGWREAVVHRRYLPNMLVSNALVSARQGGTPGRPGPAIPDVQGLFVVGDWVGPEGMLSDASLASARRAAFAILGAGPERPAAAG